MLKRGASGCQVWGAVGLRDAVTDSLEDKRWVAHRFCDDLQAALTEKPTLKAFVFFTNVELTQAEEDALIREGKNRGLAYVEVFTRKRLRILLDNPKELRLPIQSMSVPLSESEQASFLERFGAELESLILKQLEVVEQHLARLEFFQDCALPLTSASVLVKLKREYSFAELGHFRVLVQVLNIQTQDPHPTLCMAGRDGYSMWWRRDDQSTIMGVNCLMWSRHPEGERHNESEVHQVTQQVLGTLGDLDQRHLFVYVTKPLLELISGIGVQANEYVLAFAEKERLIPIDITLSTPWPEPLTEAELAVPWIELLLKADGPSLSPPAWPTKNWYLDFSAFTPSRLQTT
ncbi:MAG TPA: hypothetical protein VFL31_03075 [Nitrospiraceae bacterium]|nr:hypothetical protein [Nitrospiraceae bacterium]